MKQSHTCLAVASSSIFFAGTQPHANAATVVTAGLPAQVVGRDLDVLFSPIDSVSDLVEISAGSVYTGEGGSMVISAILNNDSIVQLFSQPSLSSFGLFSNIPLATVTGNSFTDIFPLATVKGLRFTINPAPGPEPTFTLPAGTTFTFTAVPETTTAMLSLLGLTILGTRRSRPGV